MLIIKENQKCLQRINCFAWRGKGDCEKHLLRVLCRRRSRNKTTTLRYEKRQCLNTNLFLENLLAIKLFKHWGSGGKFPQSFSQVQLDQPRIEKKLMTGISGKTLFFTFLFAIFSICSILGFHHVHFSR